MCCELEIIGDKDYKNGIFKLDSRVSKKIAEKLSTKLSKYIIAQCKLIYCSH